MHTTLMRNSAKEIPDMLKNSSGSDPWCTGGAGVGGWVVVVGGGATDKGGAGLGRDGGGRAVCVGLWMWRGNLHLTTRIPVRGRGMAQHGTQAWGAGGEGLLMPGLKR